MLSDFLLSLINGDCASINCHQVLKNGTQIIFHEMGIAEIIPVNAKNAVVISSGIHGNETGPIELVDKIARLIAEGKYLPQTRVLLIIAHREALLVNKRFIDEDLNRLFAGENSPRQEECVLANRLQQAVTAFFERVPHDEMRWHFDLHCSIRASCFPYFALLPSAEKRKEVQRLVYFAYHAGIEALLFSETPSSTFAWWSNAYHDALSITVELGQLRPLYQNDLSDYADVEHALLMIMTNRQLCSFGLPCPHEEGLNLTAEDKLSQVGQLRFFYVHRTLIKQTDLFDFTFSDSIANFTAFSLGQRLANDGDIIHCAEVDGEAIIFPNQHVALGLRTCLLVLPYQISLNQPILARGAIN